MKRSLLLALFLIASFLVSSGNATSEIEVEQTSEAPVANPPPRDRTEKDEKHKVGRARDLGRVAGRYGLEVAVDLPSQPSNWRTHWDKLYEPSGVSGYPKSGLGFGGFIPLVRVESGAPADIVERAKHFRAWSYQDTGHPHHPSDFLSSDAKSLMKGICGLVDGKDLSVTVVVICDRELLEEAPFPDNIPECSAVSSLHCRGGALLGGDASNFGPMDGDSWGCFRSEDGRMVVEHVH